MSSAVTAGCRETAVQLKLTINNPAAVHNSPNLRRDPKQPAEGLLQLKLKILPEFQLCLNPKNKKFI